MRDGQIFDHENPAGTPPSRSDDPSSVGSSPARRPSLRRSSRRRLPLRQLSAPARSVAGRVAEALGPYLRAGRHRLTHTPLPRLREQFGERTPARLAVAAGLAICLGLAAYAETQAASDEQTNRTIAGQSQDASAAPDARRADPGRASRSAQRGADRAAASGATVGPDGSGAVVVIPPDPDTSAADEPQDPPALPVGHRESGPVAGLSEAQMNNAKAIVWTGIDMGVPRHGLVVAVATAMQESNLLNLASGVVPESRQYPNQGTGWDHDSVGLFQQRSSTGWGPVGRLMEPAFASQQFYRALLRVPGWQQMPLTLAAQAVQVSAFPFHYAKHEGRATEVVNALADPNWR